MARQQAQTDRGQACALDGRCESGACAEGDCVRGALRRLLITALALVLLAWGTGQAAWLLLAGLLLFTATVLWLMERLPARCADSTAREETHA